MSPWLLATLGLASASLGIYAIGYRRRYRSADPMTLWNREFASAEAVAQHVHALTGLPIEQRGGNSVWIVWLLLDPILFIWGDLRSRRPERLLLHWYLASPTITINLDANAAHVGMTCSVPIWTEAERPLEEQEGLRCLHPIGGPRWQEGVGVLQRMARPLRYVDGKIVVDAPYLAVDAGAYPAIITAMSELVALLAT